MGGPAWPVTRRIAQMLAIGPAYERPGRYLVAPPPRSPRPRAGPAWHRRTPGRGQPPSAALPASYPGVGPATSYSIERIVKSPYVNGPSGYA